MSDDAPPFKTSPIVPSFGGYKNHKIENDPTLLAQKLRDAGLPVEHTMFGTIHHQSEDRPNGYTQDDLDAMAKQMIKKDTQRWREQLDKKSEYDED